MTLYIKIKVLCIFGDYAGAARHILRAKCAEINRDRQGQAAYKIFSIERRFDVQVSFF